MRRSTNKILTTHVGALPGPLEAWAGSAGDSALRGAVRDVVAAQLAAGTDVVNEGELTKGGNWVTFINSRLAGFVGLPAEGTAALLRSSADWQEFDDFYSKALAGGTLFEQTASVPTQTSGIRDWVCREPIRYTGQQALAREIELLKSTLGAHAVDDAFLTSTAPASIEVGRRNEHYKSDEEFLYALAEALRVEYETIAKAGLLVQIDDAWLPALWDRIGIPMGLAAYKRYCMVRVEALNHALRNVPDEQVRYHLCWGSWHGPHKHDIPLADLVDVMLAVKAQAYLFEAANARHEHEYTLWERVKLAGRQDHRTRCRHARDADRRASGARLAAHPTLRAPRGARERHRVDGLWARIALPSADRVGEARSPRRRRRSRDSRTALLIPRRQGADGIGDGGRDLALDLIGRRLRRREATDPQLFFAAAVHGASLDAYHIRVGRDASLDEDVGVERSADIARPPLSRVLGARSGARDDAEAPVAHELGRDALREALRERRAVGVARGGSERQHGDAQRRSRRRAGTQGDDGRGGGATARTAPSVQRRRAEKGDG